MRGLRKFIRRNLVFLILLAAILYSNYRFDRYFIRTGSMEPTLAVGAIVMVDPEQMPDEGEIGAYRTGGNIVIHRVLDITAEGYQFQGDANPEPDPTIITEEQVEGTVILKLNLAAPIVKKIMKLP